MKAAKKDEMVVGKSSIVQGPFRLQIQKNTKKEKKKKGGKLERKKKKSVFNFGVDPLHLILRHIAMPSPTGSMQISILGSAARALLSSNTKSL